MKVWEWHKICFCLPGACLFHMDISTNCAAEAEWPKQPLRLGGGPFWLDEESSPPCKQAIPWHTPGLCLLLGRPAGGNSLQTRPGPWEVSQWAPVQHTYYIHNMPGMVLGTGKYKNSNKQSLPLPWVYKTIKWVQISFWLKISIIKLQRVWKGWKRKKRINTPRSNPAPSCVFLLGPPQACGFHKVLLVRPATWSLLISPYLDDQEIFHAVRS